MLARMRTIWLVARKEIQETARDPHVLLLLLFPIAIYPLILWVFTQLYLVDKGYTESQSWRIDTSGPAELVSALLEGNSPASGGEQALGEGLVDLVVRTEVSGEGNAEMWEITLLHSSDRGRSLAALAQAEERLTQLRRDRFRRKLASANLGDEVFDPIRLRSKVAGERTLFTWLTSVLVSVLLPTSLLMSGLYPVIDLVVGERERATIETTLVIGVPRWVIGLGRVIAALTFEAAGVLGNLIGISLTASTLSVSLSSDVREIWIPPLSFLLALPALAATALCVTGALFLVLLPAKTFKEGEWIGSGVLMLAISPLVASVPALIGASKPGPVLFIPMTNTTIALAHAMDGSLTPAEALLPVLVNGGLGAVLLWIAFRLTSSEDWLFSDRLPAWLSWLRRWMPT